MKNKLIDLNNHLFAQLERLNDEDVSGDRLKEEIDRTRAISTVATSIIENARLALDAQDHSLRSMGDVKEELAARGLAKAVDLVAGLPTVGAMFRLGQGVDVNAQVAVDLFQGDFVVVGKSEDAHGVNAVYADDLAVNRAVDLDSVMERYNTGRS